ncbi:MAG: glycogen synthase GlgA [Nitrospirota bacterium]
MKILFAASEVAPFAMTGGLADVAGSLPQALAALGHDVRVVLPRYRQVDTSTFGLKHTATFYVPLASWKERCDILTGTLGKNVTVYFLNKDIYFDRPGLYGTPRGDYADNAERFIYFSRAVPELCRVLNFRPDIIHCNDWQTGLVPLYVKSLSANVEELRSARTVFTVHNLGYQGIFWHWDMRLTGLSWDVFTPEGIEFWGKMNLLKAGLVYADVISTVSATYSREIQTPEYGHGLDGVLRRRTSDLYGIVNGLNYDEWDPAKDPALPKTYSISRPSGKQACKESLRKQLKLPRVPGPVLGMVTRLSDQKGLDILMDALPRILARNCQIIILGTGDERYHRLLTEAGEGNADRMRVLLKYDDTLARRIYAGSDLFLMPSRYEPCGLGQMHALRYGTVPVVRRTGGLADTVINFNPRTGKGTGFVFDEYTPDALAACVERALKEYGRPAAWKRIVNAGMKVDFSWDRSAKEYEKLYRKAMKKR